MNATLRLAARACVVTAASGLLCSQVAGLLAQDSDSLPGKPTSGAKILQTQGYAPVTRTSSVQPPSDQNSDVQKELQKLYKKNNREMPSMNISELPNTQGPTPPMPQQPPQNTGTRSPATALGSTAPAASAAPAPKANWFERTFHVGRGKRKPAANTETAAPASPRTSPYRMSTPPAGARPAMPNARAPLAAAPGYQSPPTGATPSFTPPPVIAGPAASAPPAQPQLREPSPLAPSPAARELTTPSPAARDLSVRPQAPTVRPARPRGTSQPMIDESETGDDSESLDLEDNDSKPAAQAPQVLSNRNETKEGSDSPYSGLKIAPNEEERQITRQPEAASETTDGEAVEELPDASPKSTAQPMADKPAATVEQQPAAAEPTTTKGRNGIAPKDEDDEDEDDDEDDEDMLSLPSAKSGGKPRGLPEPAVLKAAKVLEKLSLPVAAAPTAAPVVAPAPAPVTQPATPAITAAEKPAAAPAPVAAAAAPVAAAPAVAPVTAAPANIATAPAAAPVPMAPAASAAEPTITPAPAPLNGLKGICPVALKDNRKLVDARPTIVSTYKGKTYAFSSAEAKQAFDENPHKYAPVSGGSDVVKQTAGQKGIEGTLEHAAWYRGRLYLFSTADTRLEFVETPSKFVIED